ncbi:DEAD/DEAH box helicase [Sphingopyxis sp. GW247-27LB]|uniref:DEAD/DEAH box helicase n=1 Tax=Sphingopyxis sp. GW247-27LB TaxID=2012632 RepID=UPI0015959031|nr:DEAD/DEAH box helicase [Sphingopyxis sp. GW247-27LB]
MADSFLDSPPVPFSSFDVSPGARWFQLLIIEKLEKLIALGFRRILVVLPTGGGKTRLAIELFKSALKHGHTAQFVVHRKELTDQTSEAFVEQDLPHSFITSTDPYDPSFAATIAGVQTLVSRLARLAAPDLVIIDEAHHAAAGSWSKVMTAYRGAVQIGLTATPQRLDGKGLDGQFDAMIIGPTVQQLIDEKFLSPYSYYAPDIPDVSKIPSLAGDYKRDSLRELMDRPHLIGDMVEHYDRLARGKTGILFATSIEHSRNLAAAFSAEGFRTAHIDGTTMDRHERRRIMEDFKAGYYPLLSAVDLIGEGLDVPGVVYIGGGRPSKSLVFHKQSIGRALRMFPGKDEAVICDHAGNFMHHGGPTSEYDWSLQGRATAAGARGPSDAIPVRRCLQCFQVSFSPAKVCPCGAEFPVQSREIETREGKLTKVDAAAAKEAKRKAQIARVLEEKECTRWSDFEALARRRGYKNPGGWARLKMSLKSGAGK